MIVLIHVNHLKLQLIDLLLSIKQKCDIYKIHITIKLGISCQKKGATLVYAMQGSSPV